MESGRLYRAEIMKERKVIRVLPKEENNDLIEITHTQGVEEAGWERVLYKNMSDLVGGECVVYYLGRCNIDGDMFAIYDDNTIFIAKGKLNSGKY